MLGRNEERHYSAGIAAEREPLPVRRYVDWFGTTKDGGIAVTRPTASSPREPRQRDVHREGDVLAGRRRPMSRWSDLSIVVALASPPRPALGGGGEAARRDAHARRERASNADGAIGVRRGSRGRRRACPGALPSRILRREKPLFSIDEERGAHADRLSAGRARSARYPDFRIDVPDPPHRRVPAFVTENTVRSATSARTENGGFSWAYAPIRSRPEEGYEAMWNHLVRFTTICDEQGTSAYHVSASGASRFQHRAHPRSYLYWDPQAKASEPTRLHPLRRSPRRAGGRPCSSTPVDYVQRGRRAWMYLPGQRRVRSRRARLRHPKRRDRRRADVRRRATLQQGDGPLQFKLLGKRELCMPYNVYRAVYEATPESSSARASSRPSSCAGSCTASGPRATLKPGKRTSTAAVFYLDEDSWARLSDQYDARGQLYRVGVAFMAPSYDVPAQWPDLPPLRPRHWRVRDQRLARCLGLDAPRALPERERVVAGRPRRRGRAMRSEAHRGAPRPADEEPFRLRHFVRLLEEHGELETVDVPLDTSDVAARLHGNPKAVLFRSLRGCTMGSSAT
jgi:hypothetical protein